MNILLKSFYIGVIGDFLLQIITYYKGNFAGLRDYFKQHGIFESLMIAGGIMFISTHLFILLKIPFNYFYLFIYGGILDIIWWYFNLMPSLKNTYYKALNPVLSFVWGGIPMMLIILF